MKKICFVTLSRSDYASLKPIILEAQKDEYFQVQTIAGGSHLLKRYGSTINAIHADGIKISHTISFLNEADDDDRHLALAYARAVSEFVKILSSDTLDIVFLLGDRWELMAAATAAFMLRIPIAHHSGGDITQGSSDNQTRYAVSNLSHLHFAAHEDHKKRLIAMGEEPWRVIVSGEPALCALNEYKTEVNDIYVSLSIPTSKPFILATYHPTSYDSLSVEDQVQSFINALNFIKDYEIILTAPNPDSSSVIVREYLIEYSNKNSHAHFFDALGVDLYYAAMGKAVMMIGNSSSGIWEAPSFGLPVVNIGRRQEGRLRGKNVIDADHDIYQIQKAISNALDPSFRKKIKNSSNPYVQGNCIPIILNGLKHHQNTQQLLAKKIIDPLLSLKGKS